MEKHKCKLCSRSFKCGRALGGHMRSHFMSLPVPLPPKASTSYFQVRDGFESLSPSSEDDEEKKDALLGYDLRENPKRSVKISDHNNPEVSSSIAAAGSVVLQDWESETDDSKKNYKNPSRKRSRRVKQWKEIEQQQKLRKFSTWDESFFTDPEPLSSVSDTSPEEDVAMCLIMMSRDKWMKNQEEEEEELENSSAAVADDEDEEILDSKFKCETCNKVFQSYQALGGHRASHKKSKMTNFQDDVVVLMQQGTKSSGLDMKIHECSLCYKVFGSGQALGGHKRAHLLSSASASSSVIAASAFAAAAEVEDDKCTVQLGGGGGASDGGNGCLIDLNLPPPMEYEEDNINYTQLVRLSLLSQF